ncbi:MAG: hypothetical protein HOG86_02140 [Candidatus Thioglobus sp.]|nr:hypothetical protein [Candidatus Thioglobus sp.]
MMNMGMDKDIITSAIEEYGLTIADVMVLMKGYEKFTESSMDEKKVMIDKVKELIEQQ